ncbi:class I SAM-dependent methyltransferase [Sansalvadorimonas verongulae]|uniref:class I SAM-dependent methyltransferase n=1 Tax=Sansalvadorimonas verongulae TaxID=2172824 RepID=UPI0018AD2B86|nr:class I SAM-dependent methyltransferase [Sansalvadorimonas verongulae]
MSLKQHEDKVIAHHLNHRVDQQTSDNNHTASYQEQVARQRAFFEDTAEWFASEEAVPEYVKPCLQRIVASGYDLPTTASPRFLDIGCGAGALFPAMIQLYPCSHITGIDLCANQLKNVESRFSDHDIAVWQGDVLDFPDRANVKEFYDAAWCNACFGNFYDQKAVIHKLTKQLKAGGKLLITHPLGRGFVQTLNRKDPSIVPGTLPPNRQEAVKLIEDSGLEIDSLLNEPELYILIYRKVGE